jgi:hypothetical protein
MDILRERSQNNNNNMTIKHEQRTKLAGGPVVCRENNLQCSQGKLHYS